MDTNYTRVEHWLLHHYLDTESPRWLINVVELIMFFVGIGFHITIIPTAIHLYRTGHTNHFPLWIYIANFINAYALALYAALSDCSIMVALNVIAMSIHGLCFSVYILVKKTRTGPILQLLVMLGSLSLIRYYLRHIAPPEKHAHLLGSVTMTTTAITLLPPLLHVNHFRRQQSCAGMPVAMSLMNFVACLGWTVYGKLLDDPYTYLPNITGFIGSALYLTMALYYGFPEPHRHKEE